MLLKLLTSITLCRTYKGYGTMTGEQAAALLNGNRSLKRHMEQASAIQTKKKNS